MSQYEIEFRSMFSKEKYDQLQAFLSANAQDLGQDDKDVYFFILPNKLLKVVSNISKNSAKLVLKLNKIGEGSSFKEIEIPFNPQEFESLASIFKELGFNKAMRSFQKRHNYNYKGVEIALKYSEDWGYHSELEIVVSSEDKIKDCEEKILFVANELGIRIMSDQELKEFTQKKEEEKIK